jgi:SAM-dependent methyltransferase
MARPDNHSIKSLNDCQAMSYANPAAYQRFMGRWSARLAPSFLRFAGLKGARRVLDVGCGTGTLARAAIAAGLAAEITGVDPIPEYVAFAREGVRHGRAEFHVGDAASLAFPAGSFDAALSLLVLQEFADPRPAVREMARVTRAGGIVATCMWDFENGLPMLSLFWRAAEAVAPEDVRRRRQASESQPHATAAALQDLWRHCGLTSIETVTLEIAMEFSSFADYWEPFLAGSTPTSAFAAALERQTGGAVARALRELIAGVQVDGSFVLPARAWAVKGTV